MYTSTKNYDTANQEINKFLICPVSYQKNFTRSTVINLLIISIVQCVDYIEHLSDHFISIDHLRLHSVIDIIK